MPVTLRQQKKKDATTPVSIAFICNDEGHTASESAEASSERCAAVEMSTPTDNEVGPSEPPRAVSDDHGAEEQLTREVEDHACKKRRLVPKATDPVDTAARASVSTTVKAPTPHNSSRGSAGNMNSQLAYQHLRPVSTSSTSAYSEVIRLQRERLLPNALWECITNTVSKHNPLRATIAEEIQVQIGRLLSRSEKNPKSTIEVLKARGRRHWAEIHQRYAEVNDARWAAPLVECHYVEDLYSRNDVNRALYFWATHHHKMTYGEIAFELHLPLKFLIGSIFKFLQMNNPNTLDNPIILD